ncbi:hypothetical protein [Bradyrhizobium sp. USDA 4529]
MTLPVFRRLNADTVSFVQPAFYPQMPFTALSADRGIAFAVPGIMPMDAPLDAAASGASMILVAGNGHRRS